MATSSSISCQSKVNSKLPITPGRPRVSPKVDITSLSISIDSKTPENMKFTDFSNRKADVLFSLAIPNALLYHWHKNSDSKSFVELVNSKIVNGSVQLCDNQTEINKRLQVQTSKLAGKIQRVKGRKREALLNDVYHLFVMTGEANSVEKLQNQVTELEDQLEENKREITQLLEDMAQEIVNNEDCLSNTCDFVNKGQQVHEVSPRQLRRKLSECRTFVQQTIWFCETFGLTPECLQLRKTVTGSPVKMSLDLSSSESTKHLTQDQEKVSQILYILDRFAVSDEAYHELSSASDLPPLHHIKRKRLIVNSSVQIHRLPRGDGAYRSPREAITEQISRMVYIMH